MNEMFHATLKKAMENKTQNIFLQNSMEQVKKWASQTVTQWVPKSLRDTTFLRAFGFFKVPLIFYVTPTVQDLSDARCVIRIPLNRRTRNHLKTMYFGTLCVGADCAGGILAIRAGDQAGAKISLIFKDFKAEFLKRVEGDADFTCEDGLAIQEAVQKAIDTGERQNLPVTVTATVPSKFGSEPVAQFVLTLSLKNSSKKKAS